MGHTLGPGQAVLAVPDCVGDWSLGSGKQENWTLVINRIRRSGLMQFRTGLTWQAEREATWSNIGGK